MRSEHPDTASTMDDRARGGPAETGSTLSTWRDLFAEGRLARFVLVCLGVWLTAVDNLVTATIMPSVGAELGGYAYFGWTVAGFMTGVVLGCACAGRLSEVFGLRMASVVAGLVFAVGCVLSALAPDMGFFVAGRLVQGVGGGWVSGFAMIAIALLFPERHLARIFAVTAAIWGLATLFGPLIGGLFAEAGLWRSIFWLFAAQALVFAFAAGWLLRGLPRPVSRAGVPWLQLATLALAIGCIGIANVISSSVSAVLLVVAGLVFLAGVLRVDANAKVRLLPHGASDLTTVCGSGYAAMFALTASSIGLSAYGPAILQELRGLSPLAAGYAVAAMAVAWTTSAFFVSGVEMKTEHRWIRIGSVCILFGAILQLLVMREAHLGLVLPAAAVMGAGFGLSSSLMNRHVLSALTDEDRAIGSSALIASRQAGGAFGGAISGVAANFAGFGTGLTEATAGSTAFWVFACAVPLAAAGVLATWQLTRNHPMRA